MTIKNNQHIVKIIIPALLLLHLIFVLYVKYYINDLSVSAFKLNYIGNIFNILLAVIILLGYVVVIISNNISKRRDLFIMLTISVFLFLPSITVLFLKWVDIAYDPGYLFGVPLKKIFLSILFLVEIYFQLYLLFVVWGLVIERKLFSHLRSAYISGISVICLMLFSFFYTIGYSDSLEFELAENKHDIAVILGAAVWSHDKPSPIFEGRIKKAFGLYSAGYVDKIQLTGGNAPGEISEAETASNYLIDLGVDSLDIIIEEYTSTTTEQIEFIKNELINSQELQKIIIVSDGFHLSRILEICKFYDVEATGISSNYKINWEKLLFYRIRESIALLMFWFFAI